MNERSLGCGVVCTQGGPWLWGRLPHPRATPTFFPPDSHRHPDHSGAELQAAPVPAAHLPGVPCRGAVHPAHRRQRHHAGIGHGAQREGSSWPCCGGRVAGTFSLWTRVSRVVLTQRSRLQSLFPAWGLPLQRCGCPCIGVSPLWRSDIQTWVTRKSLLGVPSANKVRKALEPPGAGSSRSRCVQVLFQRWRLRSSSVGVALGPCDLSVHVPHGREGKGLAFAKPTASL